MTSALVMAVVFGLLVAAVAVSLLSRVPGVVLSIAGVSLYWWDSGYTEPGEITLAVLTLVTVLVLVGHGFNRFVVTRVGGVSTVTATLGGFVGFVCFVFLGSTGLLLGAVVTVFLLEYVRRRDAKQSVLAAMAVVFGTFAARVVRVLMTLLVLLVMLTVAL